MPRPIIDYSKCKVTKTCVDVCPMSVFDVKKEKDASGKEVEKVVVAKPEDCIGCRACEVQCPEEAIKVED